MLLLLNIEGWYIRDDEGTPTRILLSFCIHGQTRTNKCPRCEGTIRAQEALAIIIFRWETKLGMLCVIGDSRTALLVALLLVNHRREHHVGWRWLLLFVLGDNSLLANYSNLLVNLIEALFIRWLEISLQHICLFWHTLPHHTKDFSASILSVSKGIGIYSF